MSPETSGLLGATVETALNACLSLDPETAAAFRSLAGRVLAIELEGMNIQLYFLLGQPIQVMQHYTGEVDTTIQGTPAALTRMALGKRQDELFSGSVKIHGNTDIGHRFQALLEQLDLDWEEQLAHLIGDQPAHRLGRLATQTGQYFRQAGDTLSQDLSEYLREEARLLPSAIEVDNFIQDVDELRDDMERLEARIRRLEQS